MACLFGQPQPVCKSAVKQLPNRSEIAKTQEPTKQEKPSELRVLFIGNSHSQPIPKILTDLFKRQMPGKKVRVQRVPDYGFLIEHANKKSTLTQLNGGNWDFVVLQAQKYSSSGRYSYPTAGAIHLSELATKQGAHVLMYPEWSR